MTLNNGSFSADNIKACNGDLLKVCTLVYKLFPNLNRPIQHQLIAKDEMKFFKQHGINHIWAIPNLVVPKLQNLEEHYRISFDQNQNDFNKQVDQEIRRPESDDLFGPSSTEEVEVVREEPPKKKAKVGFLLSLESKDSQKNYVIN